jgi:hypothetical protein
MTKSAEAKQRRRQNIARRKLEARRLTPDEEKEAIYICKKLFRCLVLLRRELIEYLNSWGIDVLPDEDTSDLLRKLRDCNQSLPKFLSATPNSIEDDTKTLGKAILGRNKLCHGNLPAVRREWTEILSAWIQVSLLIEAKSLVTEIRKTLTYLKFNPASPSSKPFSIPPLLIFQRLATERTQQWTKSKELSAIALAHHVFDILIEDVAPYVRDFIDENQIRDQWNSEIDVFGHTILLEDECCMDDFVFPPGIEDESELRQLLEKAMDGRNAVCHDQHAKIIDKWPIFLKDFINLLLAIHRPEAAQRVQIKLDVLLSERQKAENRFLPLNYGGDLDRREKQPQES